MSDIEVSIHIDAPADRVWDLIGDPTRMGEWSPECKRVNWKGGRTSAAVGAKFAGHNRNGWRRWSTTSTIVELTPAEKIAWDVSYGPVSIARWGYALTPDEKGGCTLVESFDDHRAGWMKQVGKPVRGVSDAHAHNRAGMEATLAEVKAAAERG